MNGAKAPETPSPTLQEKTVTPETLPTVIGADEGYDGLSQVTVNPDAQLKAENIRSGKTVFGVEGSFVGEPQPAEQLPLSYYVSSWPASSNNIIPIVTLDNSSNTQYYTKKITSYVPYGVGYQVSPSTEDGRTAGFRAWSRDGNVTLSFFIDYYNPEYFYCDQVTLTEPVVIEPGEYTVTCPLNLYTSVNFTGTIAVIPVLQGNGGIMTMPIKDYEIIENVNGKTNGSFKVTTTKTFTIPATDYIVDRGHSFKPTKIGFTFIPVEINQVTS